MGEKIKKAIGVQGDFRTAILPMINYSYANMYMGGAGYRKKNNVSYYKLYCEAWANAWGQKFSKMEMEKEA